MMRPKFLRAAALLLAICLPAVSLAGCAREMELNEIYIVTGVAMDATDEPGILDFCFQVAKTEQTGGGSSSESKAEGSGVILLRARAGSLSAAINRLNVESARNLFLHHNQVILIGIDLAKEGITPHIDMFMRSMESRMEVPVVVVDGRADEVLGANLEQESISGQFLAQLTEGLSAISPHYQVRLFDFSARILCGSSAPVAPVVKLYSAQEHEELKGEGLAVFRGGKLVGRMDTGRAQGYAWAMGGVRGGMLSLRTDAGTAILSIYNLTTKRNVSLLEDGTVKMSLTINAQMDISELQGFVGYTAQALIPYLNQVAAQALCQNVEKTFALAQGMRADIYELGVSVYRGHPKLWKDMEPRWPDLFAGAELSVEAKVNIPGMGKSSRSLEMGGGENSN